MARRAKRYQEREVYSEREKSYLMVGIYARLSVEDKERKSESIENQIMMIQDYIQRKNSLPDADTQFVVYDIYTDHGKTGTNFDREGFEHLMKDAKSGNIQCIIVKDFSRFGRNYIETGNYMEKILPFLGVRFISVSDGYDSASADCGHQELTMNIKNLVNDMYAKDISRKLSVSKRISQKNGDYVSSLAPYGYEVKEVQGMQELLPVPDAAGIVQWIFRMYAEGMSMKDIRISLYNRKVHRPSDYRKVGHVYQWEQENLHEWGDSSIRALFNRQNYYGDLVQHKYESGFQEGKKWCRKTEAEEWIIRERMHQPIISRELFDKVQKRMREEKKEKKEPAEDLRAFTNVMYCGNCGRKLVSHKNEKDTAYYCPASGYMDMRACHHQKIRESLLQEIVRKTLTSQMQLSGIKKKDLSEMTRQAYGNASRESQRERQQLVHQKERLTQQMAMQYMEYKEGKISQENYRKAREEGTEWEAFYHQRMKELEQEEKKLKQQEQEEMKYLRSLLDMQGKTKLNAELVETLVEKILLYEDGRLEIMLRFQGGDRL